MERLTQRSKDGGEENRMEGGVEYLNPATLAAPVMNLYSHVAVAPAGRLAFISGQVALDAAGALVGPGDHAAQARQCFANVRHALTALGAAPRDIAKMTIHVVGHTPERIVDIFMVAGRDVFGADWPLCASTYLGVAALGLPEWLVEIDAVVAVP